MNIFIIPGGRPHLLKIRDYLTDDICGILVHEKINVNDIAISKIDKKMYGKIYTLNSLLKLAVEILDGPDLEFYVSSLKKILSDQRSHYLASRSSLNSVFNNSIIIENILVNSITIIRKTNPSCLISSSTPHSLEAWIFAKCFEYLNLPIYILERTPIIDRAWIYRGMDTQSVVPLGKGGDSGVLTEFTRKIVSTQRNSRPGSRDESGMPISRLNLSAIKGAENNRWWSYKREFLSIFSGRISRVPVRLIQSCIKNILYKRYSEISEKQLPESPFVVYFMHYQPERSSLPEGLDYAQQWFAIRLLSWSLPKGWTLLVREHPTTWFMPIDFRVRTMSLYKEISSLKNTKLCSMDIDTFELIDKSSAVSTLTGKVGIQAILRGKPAVVFGLPSYKDHPACFCIKSSKDLGVAIRAIQNGLPLDLFNEDTLMKYFLWIEQNSISAAPNESNWREAKLNNFAAIYRKILCEDLNILNQNATFDNAESSRHNFQSKLVSIKII